MAITPEQATQGRTPPAQPPLDLSWLFPDTEWGVRAKVSKRGLTLADINVGSYGQVPDVASNQTTRSRGAGVRPGALRAGYPIRDKSDIWAENVAMLYEEAVARQWSSATDIPWETVKPLPDDLERAMCQLCTFLTEVEFIAGDVPGKWVNQIPNDFYEAKLFLTSQIMDEARHTDVFRKRALMNGGGLLQQGPGSGLRNILDAMDFTEMSVLTHVVGEGFVLSLFRAGELIAQNEAEKRIFRLAAQDESRHVAFGVMHLKYLAETQPERREEIHGYLDKAEGITANSGLTNNPASSEALAILMGGGLDHIEEGFDKLQEVRRRQVNEYMHRLEVAGFGDRRERCHRGFQELLDPPRQRVAR